MADNAYRIGRGTHGYAAGAIHASLFDYAERAMAVKRTDYFAAGTLVVWDVDLEAPLVRVYRSTDPTSPTTYRQGGRAEAEPAVPAWSMPVDELFPPA